MNNTKIEWCDKTWNPVTGCLHSCEYCYARKMDKRFGDGKFEPTYHPERLLEPLKIKNPSRIFAGSMADLFGEWEWNCLAGSDVIRLPKEKVIALILYIARECPQHTFIFLTKNPEGMQGFEFPSNCWLGVTVESPEYLWRIDKLLTNVKANNFFVSFEPLIAPIGDISMYLREVPGHPELSFHGGRNGSIARLKWIICGGETGPGARPIHPGWVRSLRDQCKAANIPFFFKSWGDWFPIDQPWEQDSIAPLKKNERWWNIGGGTGFHGTEVWRMRRVGKKHSGNLLNGRSWEEIPNA